MEIEPDVPARDAAVLQPEQLAGPADRHRIVGQVLVPAAGELDIEVDRVARHHREEERPARPVAVRFVVVAQRRLRAARSDAPRSRSPRLDEAFAAAPAHVEARREPSRTGWRTCRTTARKMFSPTSLNPRPWRSTALVAVADPKRAPADRRERDVGIEDLARGVELVREALLDLLRHGVEAHVLRGVEDRRLDVALVVPVPHREVHAAGRPRAEVDERVDALAPRPPPSAAAAAPGRERLRDRPAVDDRS